MSEAAQTPHYNYTNDEQTTLLWPHVSLVTHKLHRHHLTESN